MWKRNRTVIAAAIAATALAAAGVALAGQQAGGPGGHGAFGRGAGPGGGAGKVLGRLLNDPELQKSLGLSADQLTRLQQVQTSAQAQTKPMREEIRTQSTQLRALIADATAPRAQIEKQAAVVSKAVQDVRQVMLRSLLDARDILTVDQREKLHAQIKATMRQGRGQWRHGRGPATDDNGEMDSLSLDDAPAPSPDGD